MPKIKVKIQIFYDFIQKTGIYKARTLYMPILVSIFGHNYNFFFLYAQSPAASHTNPLVSVDKTGYRHDSHLMHPDSPVFSSTAE